MEIYRVKYASHSSLSLRLTPKVRNVCAFIPSSPLSIHTTMCRYTSFINENKTVLTAFFSCNNMIQSYFHDMTDT